MPEAFDAYHKWLGIPPQEQPPNHYRLLGLQVFESDLDVIANAADRQMAHVRTYQTSRYAAQSQQLLNEISAAKLCLLKADKKNPYDQALRAKLASASSPVALESELADDRVPLDFEPVVSSSAIRRERAKPAAARPAVERTVPVSQPVGDPLQLPVEATKKKLNPVVLIGAGAAALLALVLIGFLIFGGEEEGDFANAVVRPAPEGNNPPVTPPKPPGVEPPVVTPPKPPVVAPPKAKPLVLMPEATYALRLQGYQTIELGSSSQLFKPQDTFTAEMWVYPLLATSGRMTTILGNCQLIAGSQRSYRGWMMLLAPSNSEGLMLHLKYGQPFRNFYADPEPVPSTGWRHLCIQATGGQWKFFDNGRLWTTRTPNNDLGTEGANYHLGGGGVYNPADPSMAAGNGTLDFCAFRYSKVTRYQDQFDPPTRFEKDDHTEILLDFTKGSGQGLTDISGHAHDGHDTHPNWITLRDAKSAPPNAFVSDNINSPGIPYALPAPPAPVNDGPPPSLLPGGSYAVDLQGISAIQIAATQGLTDPMQEFTAEMWIRPRIPESRITMIGNLFTEGPRETNCGWYLYFAKATDNRMSLGINHHSGGGGQTLSTPVFQGWGHFCVTSSGQYINFYYDGKRHYGQSVTPGKFRPSTADLFVGLPKGKSGLATFDVRAFRLSSTQRYKSSFTPPETFTNDEQTLSLLDFSRGTGNQLPDLSGHNRYGTLLNARWIAVPPGEMGGGVAVAGGGQPVIAPPVQPPPVQPAPVQPGPVQPPAVAAPKFQPPDDAKVAAARAQVKDLFKSEYAAAKGNDDKVKLAQSLLTQAEKSGDDPVSKYALCLEALSLAIDGGNWAQSLQVINELTESFQVDAISLKTDALLGVGKLARGPAAKQAMVSVGSIVLDEIVDAQRSDLVAKLLPVLQAAAVESRDTDARKKIAARAAEIKKLQQDWAALDTAIETLKTMPDDPNANLLVGKNACFAKGRWDEGLPMLAKSNDPIAAAAQQDLNKPADAAAQVRAGDLWWDLSERDSGPAKTAMGKRAGHWYQQAMAGVSGIERLRLEKRLDQLGMPHQKPADPLTNASNPATNNTAPNNPTPPAVEPPAAPNTPRNLSVDMGQGVKMNLRLVSPGAVSQGDQILAQVDKPFYLGLTEVTQAQWIRIMGSNPSMSSNNTDLPVENVSHDECQAFLDKLNKGANGQLHFRLPTANEWTYAARAGSVGQFTFGDNEQLLGQYAQFANNAADSTRIVKQLQPNGFGFYDMHGNVWERVADPQPDGRVLCLGGSHRTSANSCSFRARNTGMRDSKSREIGFRVACDKLTPAASN